MTDAYSANQIAKLNSIISGLSSTPSLATQFADGLVRAAGGKVSIAASGTGYFCLTNPSGSGKTVTLQQFTLAADNAADIQFQFDTVLSSPSALTPFSPNRAVSGSTAATAATSTAVPTTAGTTLSPVYRLGQNLPFTQDFTVVLTPGQSVAAVVAVGPTATVFYAAATWTEV